MRSFLAKIAAVLMTGIPALAGAWESAGHQQVGALAEQLIAGSNAELRVREILGGVSLATAATWADCARSVRSPDGKSLAYQNDDQAHPECQAFSGKQDRERLVRFARSNWKQCGTAAGKGFCHEQYHYTGIAEIHQEYSANYVGANSHDVVAAINAAVAYLRRQAVAAPFAFADDREALMLLAHYVGDLHQPLHVEAVYLDDRGNVVNPDAAVDPGKPSHVNGTAGGNALILPAPFQSLHRVWDAVPEDFRIGGARAAALLNAADTLGVPPGDIKIWPQAWASDAMVAGDAVFAGLRFAAIDGSPNRWTVSGYTPAYRQRADDLKFAQLAKAGARLARLLKAIWGGVPQAATTTADVHAPALKGYLSADAVPSIKAWLPPQPAPGSAAEKADIEGFLANRHYLVDGTPRGQQAAEDDVHDPVDVLERFKEALGVALTPENAPSLMLLIDRVQEDASAIVRPVKLSTPAGGRIRPFMAFPDQTSCLYPKDLANKRAGDLKYRLPENGSYPSGHALLGMIVAMILSEADPDSTDDLMARGLAFGESRLICGFHYPSDLAGGRLVASVLFARLQSSPEFQSDMAQVRDEIHRARGRP